MPNDPPPSLPRLGIAAIFRNEGPYILEWVAFHRVAGCGPIIIADNASDDGSTPLLAALDRAGIIRHLPFPGRPGEPPQLPAYREIMHRFKDEADWWAFIDADEFLTPNGRWSSLPAWLATQGDDVGAVAVNWSIYGSSGRDLPGEGLVTERFTMRASETTGVNRHYKSIVRAADFLGTSGNPHHFRIRAGQTLVDSARRPVQFFNGQSGKSDKIRWGAAVLRHYIIKSRSEFVFKKLARGRATKFDHLRDMKFFASLDRNHTEAPLPAGLAQALRAEVATLRALLTDLPPEAVALDTALARLGPAPADPA